MKRLYPSPIDNECLRENFVERKCTTDNKLLTIEELMSLLRIKTNNIVTGDHTLGEIINKKNPIIKFGIDATGREMHLGHTMPINILRLIQLTGKEITFVIGDFTAKIGDPTGRNKERIPLSDKEIQSNYKNYKDQAGRFINMEKTNVVYNSSILENLSLRDVMENFQKISVNNLLQRDDFKKRIDGGGGLTLSELSYPLLMAIDSVKLNTDLEIGGSDQLLNFHITRELMQKSGLFPEAFITVPLLPGITGNNEKMSKSLNNYIGLMEPAQEIFAKVMSVPDTLLQTYIFNMVDIQDFEKKEFIEMIKQKPFLVKKSLAYLLVYILKGEEEAKISMQEFDRKFSQRDLIESDFVYYKSQKGKMVDILSGLGIIGSKSEVRRLVKEGAIKSFDGKKQFSEIKDEGFNMDSTIYLRVGKKKFVKIEIL